MRVLFAGDSPTTRPLVQGIVEGLGHEGASATDGAEAWDHCANGIADVVIGDWRTPGFDGLELCQRIRAHPTVGDTYFIMLLAPGDRCHARQAVEAGANDFLVEPLDAEELQLRLVAAARVTALHRQLADLQRTQGRLQGVTLANRELAHRLNNDLALALGTFELVRARVPMPETFRTLVDDAVDRLEQAGRHVADLQQVVHAATGGTPVSPSLDLPRPVGGRWPVSRSLTSSLGAISSAGRARLRRPAPGRGRPEAGATLARCPAGPSRPPWVALPV